MVTCNFDKSNPNDYKSLRGLIAPSLAGVELDFESASSTSKACGKSSSRVPQVILPREFGDPSTWTQAEKGFNTELKSRLEEYESCPPRSKAERTAAMVDIILGHPSVSFYGHDRVESAESNNEDTAHDNDGDYIDVPGQPQVLTRERKVAENHFTTRLRRHLEVNNNALLRGGEPTQFAGPVGKCEAPVPRKDTQDSLLKSIDLQIQLSDVKAKLNNPRLTAAIQTLWKSSVSNNHER
jgi:hypothetical protein